MKKCIKALLILAIVSGTIYLFWKPICNAFSAIYNFIQTNPLFTTNLFNFILVSAFFVWLLFFKLDVVGMLDKKSKETAKLISDAENKNTEAQMHLEETQKSMQNLDEETKKIVTEAKNLAKNLEASSQAKLENELTSLKNREILLQDAQINKAKNKVSVVIANAAVAISKEYIKNSLDENTHRELIYNFIDDLDEGLKL